MFCDRPSISVAAPSRVVLTLSAQLAKRGSKSTVPMIYSPPARVGSKPHQRTQGAGGTWGTVRLLGRVVVQVRTGPKSHQRRSQQSGRKRPSPRTPPQGWIRFSVRCGRPSNSPAVNSESAWAGLTLKVAGGGRPTFRDLVSFLADLVFTDGALSGLLSILAGAELQPFRFIACSAVG